MLKLQVANPDITNGTMQVSWCLDKELIAKLIERGSKDPYIVVVVYPKEKDGVHFEQKEHREIFPLKDFIGYVPFKFSGENRVVSFIVDNEDDARAYARRHYDNTYSGTVVESDCEIREVLKVRHSADFFDVFVPHEAFAKPPPEWEVPWVTWMLTDKYNDQCSYRRKRLFAYTIQPFAFLFSLLLSFILFCFSFLLGLEDMRGKLQHLIHPLTKSCGEFMSEMVDAKSIFFSEKTGYSRFLYLLSPLSILLGCFAAWVSVKAFVVTFGIAFNLIIIFIVLDNWNKIKNLFNGVKNNEEEKENKKPEFWYLEPKNMDLLVCSENTKPLTVKELPKENRTIKLKYLDLKSKVCKPFQG